MTPQETITVLTYMQAVWPSFTKWDETTVVVWSDLLSSYTQPQVAGAVREMALGNSAFAPSPGQISAHIDGRDEDGWRPSWPMVARLITAGRFREELTAEMFDNDDRAWRAARSVRLRLLNSTADHGQRIYADAWRDVGPNDAAAALETPTGPVRAPGSTCTAELDCPGGCLGQGMTFEGDDYQPCMGAQ